MSEVTSSTRQDSGAPAAEPSNGFDRPPKRGWRWPGLTHLSVRWMMQRKARTVLTGAGIALGVALLFGTLITAESSTQGYRQMIDAATGEADVLVTPGGTFGTLTPGGATLDGDLIAGIGELPGVRVATPTVGFLTVIEGSSGTTELRINQISRTAAFGVDFHAAGHVYRFELDEGRLPARGPEVVVPARLAGEIGANVGSDLVLTTPSGNRRVTLVGLLSETGAGLVNRGHAAFMPLETARELAGTGDGAASIVLVGLDDGVDLRQWIGEAEVALGPGVNAQPVGELFEFFARLLDGMAGIYTTSSAVVVLVAGFLVYLTLSTAVVERTRLYGTLYALGARRRQIRGVVLSEALVLGVVATSVGLLAGLGLPYLLLPLTRRFTGEFAMEQVVPLWAVLLSAAFGVVVAAASALLPARRAARIDPVESMRGDFTARLRPSRGWIAGLVSLCVGLALALLRQTDTALSMLGASGVGRMAIAGPLLLFGALAMIPLVLRPLARMVGGATSRLARGVGEVAVYHLSKERARSAYTLGLVMLVVAISLMIGAAHSSFGRSFDRNADQLYGADFILYAASTFDDDFSRALADMPGIRAVTPETFVNGQMLHEGETEDVQIRLIDPAGYFQVSSFDWTDGDETTALEALSPGGTVVLAEATSTRLGLGVGDSITLATAAGPREFVVGSVAVISNAVPTMYLGDANAELFGMSGASALHVLVDSGADVEGVRATVERELGERSTFVVATIGDIKEDTRAQIAAGLNGSFVLLLLMGLVGMFGLANTLAMSIQERQREIGILRSIGVRRRQLVGMTLVESATLVAVAVVLGLPLGVLLSRLTVPFAIGVLGDMTVSYAFPWGMVPILAVGAIAVAVLASVGPGRRAARIEIEEALRVE